MPKSITVALIGGDKRQLYLGENLYQENWEVLPYGLDIPSSSCLFYSRKISWKQIVKESQVIIAPIPFTRDNQNIFMETSNEAINIYEFLDSISSHQILFGGNFPDIFLSLAKEKNKRIFDFMKCEEFSSFNAIATAEGSIMEAIRLSPWNLEDSEVLIIGYGCCGTVIAKKCQMLDAHVTIVIRRKELIPLLEAKGYHCILIDTLSEKIGNFRFLFNTAPSLILDALLLGKVQKDSVIIDIASNPGGIDKEAAMRCHLATSHFLGIPGKIAPKSSAHKLTEIVKKKEKESWDRNEITR